MASTAAASSSSHPSPSSDQNNNPFVRTLLPRPPSALTAVRPRLVLLQHTLSLKSRLLASSPAAGAEPSGSGGGSGISGGSRRRGRAGSTPARNSTEEKLGAGGGEDELYRLAGLRTPSECAVRDLSGGSFVLAAMEALVRRTGGRVVWVSAADNLVLPEEGDDFGRGWVGAFRNFGTTVDLASDPLGWDDDGDNENDDEEKRDGDDDGDSVTQNKVRVFRSRMDDLESVASAVERAAAAAAAAAVTGADSKEDGPRLIDEDDTAGGDGDSVTRGSRAAAAVPVVFDSINPLLMMHGIGRTMQLLRRLIGRGRGENGEISIRQHLSPVVVPVLAEAVRGCDLRRLEDEADGVLTLSGGEMRTVRKGGAGGGKGGAAGRLVNDVLPFRIESLGGARRQAGAATELVLGPEGDEQLRGGAAAVGGVASVAMATEAADAVEAQPLSSGRSFQSQRSLPTLRHEEGARDEPQSHPLTSPSASYSKALPKAGAPRIFVQDDDPEYDDLDEEDLDDDLDL